MPKRAEAKTPSCQLSGGTDLVDADDDDDAGIAGSLLACLELLPLVCQR